MCSPKSNKFGRIYHAHAVTFGWGIISQIARYEVVGRGSQRNFKKRLIIRIGQIQHCIGWGNRQTIHLKFDQHFPDANGVKFEMGPDQNFRVLGKDSLVMAGLDGACQSERQNRGGISFAVQ